MIALLKRKRAASILGIALDGNRLEVISLRRSNGTLHLRQTLAVPLALSPLTDASELVGQEIRNHLDQLGIRERRCAVCLPLSWVLSLQSQVPELSEEDRASFLELEAERGFHSGPEALFTAHSFFKTPAGEQYTTFLAVPRDQLETLERVLRAAKLKPVTFALGVTALQAADAEAGRVIVLALRNNTVDLQVTAGGGIVALRSLDGAIETQGDSHHLGPVAGGTGRK
jgi:Tfp pilus assembly PilM family ATPase